MTEADTEEGTLLWTPTTEFQSATRMSAYLGWLARERGLVFHDYAELHAWSVREVADFWQSIWDYFGIIAHRKPERVLSGSMPDARWFEGATLNYAEHALRRRDGHAALVFRNESAERQELSYAELCERVAAARAGMRRLGISKGDRVVAILPNCLEAVVAFLASASLGAIWSSCSPEFGVSSVLDRFQQVEPALLLVADRYRYGGKVFERGAELTQIRAGLGTLRAAVCLERPPAGFQSWAELTAVSEPLLFEPVPFEHPLWILYSSGTTGLPKAIVQSHGGILLEHSKALALHCDIREDDRFFWFTTTGWMMWNFLIGGLLLGATVVLYDGSPAVPSLDALWQLAEDENVSYFGTSAPYLLACAKADLRPGERHALSGMRSLGTTGAPLPASGFAWVYRHVKAELLLGSVSGGTDVCTAFVLSCPLLPVHAGEIQCAGLGARVESFDEQGRPLSNAVGELVLTEPLPSMPVRFWNDPGDARRRDSYFSTYEGVWRHGDWIKRTTRGTFVIYGRSDSTLNRGGVRMGTSEFYGVVESLPEIEESLVVDTGSLDDESGKLWLFVVLRPGFALDERLRKSLKDTIKKSLSPRHVPDEIRTIDRVPRTLNGKKLEVPVKRILLGTPVEQALGPGTVALPSSISPFIALASELRAGKSG